MTQTKLTNRDTAYFCRSLASLLHAGISTEESCWLLAQEEQGILKAMLGRLAEELNAGLSLGEALARQPEFPAATAGLIRTGDCTGRTEEALLSAAGYHETMEHTARQLRSALGYPLLLLVLMLTVVGILLIRVLPVFDSVYVSLGSRLTGAAAGLLHLGQGLEKLLPLLFALGILVLMVFLGCRLFPSFRKYLFAGFRRLTDDRGLLRSFSNARFVQALSMGICSGLVPEEAIELAGSLLADSPGAASRCGKCLAEVQSGTDLAQALESSGLMSAHSCRMLKAGLVGGNADQILLDIADRMQQNARQELEDLLGKIEPAIVLLGTGLVGLILLSVMLPLLDIMSALG